MPKANREAKPENVAMLTPYTDQHERLLIVLVAARGVVRAFAVVPENRGPVTLQRAQEATTAAATSWAQERGAVSLEWQAPKRLPLPDGRDIGLAMEMVRVDAAHMHAAHTRAKASQRVARATRKRIEVPNQVPNASAVLDADQRSGVFSGAGHEARTRDLKLGKLDIALNRRHN